MTSGESPTGNPHGKFRAGLAERDPHPLLAAHGRAELRSALLFIHQVCNVLRRQKPASAEWQATLTVKALDILNHHNPAAIEAAFKWFIANRDSQEIPPRLDCILDRFPEFIKKGQRDFG